MNQVFGRHNFVSEAMVHISLWDGFQDISQLVGVLSRHKTPIDNWKKHFRNWATKCDALILIKTLATLQLVLSHLLA